MTQAILSVMLIVGGIWLIMPTINKMRMNRLKTQMFQSQLDSEARFMGN